MKTIAIASFRAQDWPKLLAVAADRATLPDSFARFEALSRAEMAAAAAGGVHLERVLVSLPALITWCRATCRPVDANARNAFAAFTLARATR